MKQNYRMTEADNKYKMMWGARVLTPCDMPDDILRYCITSVSGKLNGCPEVIIIILYRFSASQSSG